MSLLKKITTVATSTLMSRLLGFTREMFMAAAVGTGPVADAFNAAFRFPNTFRRLFGEGAFNSAFIPLFSKRLAQKDKRNALDFAEEVFGVLFSLLVILTLIMEFSMPFLVRYVIAPGFGHDPEKFKITTRFASIMFPYLTCMSLAAMMSGMLNALRRYFAASIAPIFLNIILIGILAYAWYSGRDVSETGILLSWGVVMAGFVQLFIIWSAMRHAGVVIHLRRPHFSPNIRHLLKLALPAALTGGVTQINLLINTSIASTKSGAISALAYADRLYQLPLGVVGIAVATVLLPELTRSLRDKQETEASFLQKRATTFSLFLTLPASVGFLVMAEPIVRLLFERGHFSAQSTELVASILTLYGLGLPAFVLIKAFLPNFFAREDTRTPFLFSLLSMITNITLALSLFPIFGARGIAIAEITAAWLNTALLFFTLVKRGHWKKEQTTLLHILRLLLSAVIMGLAIKLGLHVFADKLLSSTPLVVQFYTVFGMIFAACLVYFCGTFITGAVDSAVLKRVLQYKKT